MGRSTAMPHDIPERLALSNLITKFSGRSCRHIPDGSPYEVLDTRFAERASTNRWNRQGEPTFYVAGDHGVLIAEFARHLKEQRTAEMGRAMIARRIYDLELDIPHLLDLRDSRVISALSLSNAPACFLDREIARATADFLRRTTTAEALLLPSIAFLDQPERWVMAIFLEKLPNDIEGVVTSVTADGTFRHED